MKEVTIDHIMPRIHGGLDVIDNLQLAHFACNQAKGSMLPEEFRLFQEGIFNG